MEFEIVFYKDSLGNNPIEEFILKLEKSNKELVAQVRRGLEKLRNRAYHKEPLSKYVEPGLWELRVKAGTDIMRILYTFERGRVIILLHSFVKKQQNTPVGELEIARKRLKEVSLRRIEL
jgi:phage-related protein